MIYNEFSQTLLRLLDLPDKPEYYESYGIVCNHGGCQKKENLTIYFYNLAGKHMVLYCDKHAEGLQQYNKFE